jgi:membrane protein required for colicin V production
MNAFDAAVVAVVIVLALLGFRAGLLRSLADILGFVIAAPLAVALAPYFSSAAPAAPAAPAAAAGSPWGQNSLVLFGLLLVGGILFAQLLRHTIEDFAGSDIHLLDRSAGFLLGAVRALLVAITIVLIFDRIIPIGREPEFLKGSKVRPLLSLAAQRGLRSLPPEVSDYIDRLKRERGL